MKIGFFLNRLDYKSAVAKFTLKLARETVSAGHGTDICYVTKAESAELRRELSAAGARTKWIPSLMGALKLYTTPYGAELRRIAGNYDLSVAQNLMFRQDVIIMNNDPQTAQVEALGRTPFTVAKPGLWTRRRKLRAAIESRRFRPENFKKAVAPSIGTARRITGFLDIDPDRISVIPLGVDSRRFCPELRRDTRPEARRELGISDDETVFLYAGDFWKGLEFAILGLARIARKRKIKLLAVGTFDPEPFRALSIKTGLPFAYFNNSEDIRFFYSAADAFLLPTPLDTFNLTALEAMAMGLPVVLSRYAGLSELLTHQNNALVLDNPFDPSCVAEQALAILDKDFANDLGARARDLARTMTWEKTARSHLELYEVLSGEGGKDHHACRPIPG